VRYFHIVGILLASARVYALGAQVSPPQYDMRRLNGAVFLENVRTDVTSQSGTAEMVRRTVRGARFGVAVRGDTMAVTADSLALYESADGVQRTIDVDAVIGGRWTLTLAIGGNATVLTQPFVPGEIADVSDIAMAMNDFFPATTGWRRLADSAGLSRYHWSGQHHSDSSYVATDSVPVQASIDTKEDGDVAWDVARGPVAWSRLVETTAASRFSGRTSRAVITQRIGVRRVR
jgi:hypothetical protein